MPLEMLNIPCEYQAPSPRLHQEITKKHYFPPLKSLVFRKFVDVVCEMEEGVRHDIGHDVTPHQGLPFCENSWCDFYMPSRQAAVAPYDFDPAFFAWWLSFLLVSSLFWSCDPCVCSTLLPLSILRILFFFVSFLPYVGR